MQSSKPTYEVLEQRIKELEAQLSDEKTEWAILRLLAQEWDGVGPPGIIDNRELISRLNITAEEAAACLEKLVGLGIVDKDQGGFASYLTPEGYELANVGKPDIPIKDTIRRMRTKSDA